MERPEKDDHHGMVLYEEFTRNPNEEYLDVQIDIQISAGCKRGTPLKNWIKAMRKA